MSRSRLTKGMGKAGGVNLVLDFIRKNTGCRVSYIVEETGIVKRLLRLHCLD